MNLIFDSWPFLILIIFLLKIYKGKKMNINLIKKIICSFRTITPQDYLMNQREAGLSKTPHVKTLYPL